MKLWFRSLKSTYSKYRNGKLPARRHQQWWQDRPQWPDFLYELYRIASGDSRLWRLSAKNINIDNLIDAYDFCRSPRLDGGCRQEATEKVSVSVSKQYQRTKSMKIDVKGNDLRSVNALSCFTLWSNDYEFVGVEPLNMKAMENLTYDRLHTDSWNPHPFRQYGKTGGFGGSEELFILKLKAET